MALIRVSIVQHALHLIARLMPIVGVFSQFKRLADPFHPTGSLWGEDYKIVIFILSTLNTRDSMMAEAVVLLNVSGVDRFCFNNRSRWLWLFSYPNTHKTNKLQ